MAQEAGVPLSYDQARLADSRAQFVANLGRRMEAIRQALTALERSPRSAAHRDNLRRRVHALGAAAGVLGFDRVQVAFGEAEGRLNDAAASGNVTEDDIEGLSRTFDLVPSLALGAPDRPRPPRSPTPGAIDVSAAAWPLAVVVVGSSGLSGALESQSSAQGTSIECQQTEDLEHAVELLQLVAPDVVVVDVDRRGARDLLDRLLNESDLDPVPAVLVGSFDRPEAAAGLIAMGVARVLPKPVGPETLRRTVVEVARDAIAAPPPVEPIGDVTVEALAERVAQEVRRGLVDAVKPLSRATTVPLGEGTDALAAVWASVARLRELVTMRSGGSVRFDASGPEGAVPLAPWSAEERRRASVPRGRLARDVDLTGLSAIVADDDPSVVWFLSGLLSAAGMEVFEAGDGKEALALAREHVPDLVISDILMPELDGFGLCREIKRDILLSDVPVILLSWKEDLLQRVRELGADAQAYLRKEAAGSTVLDRVREVLWPRVRIEQRIAAGGEVRGRLDGLTPRSLLQAVCKKRLSVHVAIRDAAYLYEAHVRGGRLRSLTRTAPDGTTDRGEPPLAALLGVRSGRFSVRGDVSECHGELEGDLDALVAGPVTRARKAMELLVEPRLFSASRLVINEEAVASYTATMPRAMRAVVARLAAGVSPAELVESGRVGVGMLESVILDLIRHGGVMSVFDGEGIDRLGSGVEEVIVQRATASFSIGTPSPGPAATATFEPSVSAEPSVSVEPAPPAVSAEPSVPAEPAPPAAVAPPPPAFGARPSEAPDADDWEAAASAFPSPTAEDVPAAGAVGDFGDLLPPVGEVSDPVAPAKPTGWAGVMKASPSSSPVAPLAFAKEPSPLEHALRASSGSPSDESVERASGEVAGGPGPSPDAEAERAPVVGEIVERPAAGAEAAAPASERKADTAEDRVAVAPPPSTDSGAEPSSADATAPTAESTDDATVGTAEASSPEPEAMSDEASAFAALLGGDAEAESDAADSSVSERPSQAGSRAAPETKAPAEPSPFAAAFDRLSDEPPEPKESAAAGGDAEAPPDEGAEPAPGARLGSADAPDGAGWSIAIEQSGELPRVSDSERPTALPEDRATREMPPRAAPPEAFRSSPPAEATPAAVELGIGLVASLGDASPPPPAGVTPATRPHPPPKPPRPDAPRAVPRPESAPSPAVVIAPTKPIAFPRPVERRRAAPGKFDETLLGMHAPPPSPEASADGSSGSVLPPTERSSVAGRAEEIARAADDTSPEPSGSPQDDADPGDGFGVDAGLAEALVGGGPDGEDARSSAPDIQVGEATVSAPPPPEGDTPAGVADEESPPPSVIIAAAAGDDVDDEPARDETPSDSAKPVSVEPPLSSSDQPTLPPRRRRGPPEWARSVGFAAITVVAAAASYAVVNALVAPDDEKPAEAAAAKDPSAVSVAPAASGEQIAAPPETPGAPTPSAEAPAEPRLVVTPGAPAPAGMPLGSDKGVIDFDTGDAHSIYVDGVFVGRGPRRVVPVAAGRHEVRLSLEGDEITQSVDIEAGKGTRVARPSAEP